ncbi:MAG TPA: hypothetical protein VEI07_02485 [Planctomycetaceae bacterium]|nr:hypothetical protein [Planctomycetaceae bacterium]
MNQILANPMVALCAILGVAVVAIVAIVFVTDYLHRSRQAALDAYLKQDMLNRGMSAAEIKTVLEASSDGEAARLALNGSQGIRVGLGKLQVAVGNLRKSAADLADAAEAKC